ncbi:MAG: prolipoprotein diacylglyceryl transferase [Fimbriimonadaceae bacterium]|nr:prolipoprotein diacylglyceryl transferase [Fimbriimonadaceae bacterium]
MKPELFRIGEFKVHSYGVMILVAFLAALWLAQRRARQRGFDPGKILDISIWTLIAGILGARVTFIVQDLPYYLANTKELFSLQFQGLTSFGGLIFGALAFVFLAKRARLSVPGLLDVCAPSFLVGHIVGRVGCLLNGCCYGGACTLPWAVHVHGLPGTYHPAQIYDSLLNVVALAILLAWEKRGRLPGQVFGAMLVLHGLTRFAYEFWRAGASSTYWGSLPVTEAQVAALALSAVGVVLVVMYRRAANKTPPSP